MPEPQPHDPPRHTEQAALVERRAAPRYPCNIPTLGRDPAGGRTWVATIRNVSATGVALVLADHLKPGAVLVIQLQSAHHRLSRPLPVRVMHAQPQPEGWVHGCAFLRPVREDDLQELLADSAG
jgi:hypothetical protein